MTRRTAFGGRRAVLLALGLVPALAACTSTACTLIGCQSSVVVDVASLKAKAYPLSATAKLCVQDQCSTRKVTFLTDAGDTFVEVVLPTGSSFREGEQVPVTLTVSQGGSMLADITTTAALARSAPNGERCGPICFSARLVVAGATLVPAS